MSVKMTDAALDGLLRWVGWMDKSMGPGGTAEADLRAHIAALTAERDEALEDAKRADTAAVRNVAELDALRERVRALERENTQHCTWREVAEARATQAARARDRAKEAVEQRHRQAQDAESRLAAIRQWAGDTGHLGVIAWNAAYSRETESMAEKTPRMAEAVARYIVGDDAPASSEMDGLREECGNTGIDRRGAEPIAAHADPTLPEWMCGPHPVVGGWGVVCVLPKGHEGGHSDGTETDEVAPPPEPTTAEAFAKLRGFLREDYDPEEFEALSAALSLLERRMGAALALANDVEQLGNLHSGGGVVAVSKAILATLTDAPTVFTLEDVCKAMERTSIYAPARRDVVAALTALRRTP